jgi:hypothetical protein
MDAWPTTEIEEVSMIDKRNHPASQYNALQLINFRLRRSDFSLLLDNIVERIVCQAHLVAAYVNLSL